MSLDTTIELLGNAIELKIELEKLKVENKMLREQIQLLTTKTNSDESRKINENTD